MSLSKTSFLIMVVNGHREAREALKATGNVAEIMRQMQLIQSQMTNGLVGGVSVEDVCPDKNHPTPLTNKTTKKNRKKIVKS